MGVEDMSEKLEPLNHVCEKCGAPVTTGLMAVFCPRGKSCEFWVDAAEELAAEFLAQKANQQKGSTA